MEGIHIYLKQQIKKITGKQQTGKKSDKKISLCYVSHRKGSVLLFATAWYYSGQDAILMLKCKINYIFSAWKYLFLVSQ